MKTKIISNFFLTLILFSSSGMASANTIVINGSMDLGAGGSINGLQKVGDDFSVQPTVAVGDTVDLKVMFYPGQIVAMTGNGNDTFWSGMFAGNNNSTFTITNNSMTLLGLSGSLLNSLQSVSESSGQAHIGPYFSGNFIGAGNSISFTGFRDIFTVTSLAPNGSDTYARPFMQLGSELVTVSVVSAPEPSAIFLLSAGLAGLFLGKRRKLN
jgi:PEP-CTERM motif